MTHSAQIAIAAAFSLLTIVPLSAAPPAPAPLHAPQELSYTLQYGGLSVGRVIKTLKRAADGSYELRSHSRPLGAAKMVTSVEWFEEGQFEVVQGRVRPVSFLEYRVGADKPHRHGARFDWKAQKINYAHGGSVALPPDTQDQGSLLYAFMLHPPVAGGEQTLHVSTGKKLRVYRYVHAGNETLKTALGDLKTIVIERRVTDADSEGLRVWLATDRGNLPVRIVTHKRGRETTLELESVTDR